MGIFKIFISELVHSLSFIDHTIPDESARLTENHLNIQGDNNDGEIQWMEKKDNNNLVICYWMQIFLSMFCDIGYVAHRACFQQPFLLTHAKLRMKVH